jgi:hypothetical protein
MIHFRLIAHHDAYMVFRYSDISQDWRASVIPLKDTQRTLEFAKSDALSVKQRLLFCDHVTLRQPLCSAMLPHNRFDC